METREAKLEACAAVQWNTGNRSSMSLDNLLENRHPQSGSTLLRRVKRLEQFFLLLGIESRAIVATNHLDVVRITLALNFECYRIVARCQRILKKIFGRLARFK